MRPSQADRSIILSAGFRRDGPFGDAFQLVGGHSSIFKVGATDDFVLRSRQTLVTPSSSSGLNTATTLEKRGLEVVYMNGTVDLLSNGTRPVYSPMMILTKSRSTPIDSGYVMFLRNEGDAFFREQERVGPMTLADVQKFFSNSRRELLTANEIQRIMATGSSSPFDITKFWSGGALIFGTPAAILNGPGNQPAVVPTPSNLPSSSGSPSGAHVGQQYTWFDWDRNNPVAPNLQGGGPGGTPSPNPSTSPTPNPTPTPILLNLSIEAGTNIVDLVNASLDPAAVAPSPMPSAASVIFSRTALVYTPNSLGFSATIVPGVQVNSINQTITVPPPTNWFDVAVLLTKLDNGEYKLDADEGTFALLSNTNPLANEFINSPNSGLTQTDTGYRFSQILSAEEGLDIRQMFGTTPPNFYIDPKASLQQGGSKLLQCLDNKSECTETHKGNRSNIAGF